MKPAGLKAGANGAMKRLRSGLGAVSRRRLAIRAILAQADERTLRWIGGFVFIWVSRTKPKGNS